MLTQNFVNTEFSLSEFLKKFIDYVEEIPNDVQKFITKCRELDNETKSKWFLKIYRVKFLLDLF